MDPDFSEFSYGYCVTEELVSTTKAVVTGAPVFPSLYAEGKKGGGYDVSIPFAGRPIFLQFKLSSYLRRRSAKEYRDRLLGVPYYRMYLRPLKHSDQHNLLRELETAGETVFYVAPEFHLPAELNEFYLRKTVVQNSVAFSPNEIGELPSEETHYLAFERDSTVAFRRSDDVKELKKKSLKDGLAVLAEAEFVESRTLGEEGLRIITDRLIDVLERGESRIKQREKAFDVEGIRRISSERSPLDAVGYITRAFFDAELVIIPNEL